MDWLRLPPLSSLRAFSVLAEAGGYSAAARALNVTHAAIIQQVRALEERLGITLVERDGRTIRLTDAGAALARDLQVGFKTIGLGVERLVERGQDAPVQVTMSPAFAVEWLMPRLPAFQRAHPDTTMLLNPTGRLVELRPGGIDVAIRYRDKRRPVASSKPVLTTDMVVIGAAALLEGQSIARPADLLAMPWLQELGTNEAVDWLTYRGVVVDQPMMINQMPGNLIMDAVRRGDGITYTARAFFREELADGRMTALFSESEFGVYHIETLPGRLRPKVKVFVDWLLDQAECVTA